MTADERPQDERPRRLLIPRSRRLVIDMMWLWKRVPTVAHDRVFRLDALSEARHRCPIRVSWATLFFKAFALVSQKQPLLRQVYMPFPWPHLYQHSHSVATVATHRDVEGEPWLFWSKFSAPETTPLDLLQRRLEKYQTGPVPQAFRQQWRFSFLPTWLRRLVWLSVLHLSGQRRVRQCGTFLLTTVGSAGAEIRHPPGFLTSNLTYGPFDDDHRCRVTLAYDHRLFDGRFAASVLRELEETLNGDIAAELRAFATSSSSREAA